MLGHSTQPRFGGFGSTNSLVDDVDDIIEGEFPLLTFETHGKEFKRMTNRGRYFYYLLPTLAQQLALACNAKWTA